MNALFAPLFRTSDPPRRSLLLLLLLLLLSPSLRRCHALTTTTTTATTTTSTNDVNTSSFSSSSSFSFRARYADHWKARLREEHRSAVEELRERRRGWSRRRLETSGTTVFDGRAEPASELYGDKIVRVRVPGGARSRERFARGDVLVLTTEEERDREDDAWFGGRRRRRRRRFPTNAAAAAVPRECVVVDAGDDWIEVGVGPTWPAGLWERRKDGRGLPVRLDRCAPVVPLRAQTDALDALRRGEAGRAADALAESFFADETIEKEEEEEDRLFTEEEIREALRKAQETTSFVPNESQKEAIVWALQRRISLIRGPPGTGKTRVAALLIATVLQLSSSSSSSPDRVLAVAHSNGAADVLTEALLRANVPAVRLGRPASVSASTRHRTVSALAERVASVVEGRRLVAAASSDAADRAAATFEFDRRVDEARRAVRRAAPAVVASCVGARRLSEDDDRTRFPLVVLDEAAQATEPALLCAAAAARADRVVLVGDARQLPPTVASADRAVREGGLGTSPMERLERRLPVRTLREQYRMPPSLCEFPFAHFYDGTVACAPTLTEETRPPPAGVPWPNPALPLAYVDVGDDDEERDDDDGGRSNPREAAVVVDVVARLLAAGDVDAADAAVITPYGRQARTVRRSLERDRRTSAHAGRIRVGTVDSFQGRETGVVVLSTVRSNKTGELGFLRDPRRLCVAVTRARRGLVVVGDRSVLRTCRHWSALLDSCDQRGCSTKATDDAEGDAFGTDRRRRRPPTRVDADPDAEETTNNGDTIDHRDLFDASDDVSDELRELR